MRIGLRSPSVVSVAAAVAAALLVGACGGGKGGSYSGKSSSSATTAATATASTIQAAGVGVVVRGERPAADGLVVAIHDNYFEPNIIDGTANQVVTLTLTNNGSALHNFSLTAQSVDTDVQPGKTASVKVTFPASGTLDFFCKYHKDESGMAGTLKVRS